MPTGVTELRGDITGATIAQPPVITSNAHGLSNGDIVRLTQLGGSIEFNNQQFRVSNAATNTFELQDEQTREDFDATDYTAYTTGGRWNKINRSASDRVFYEA